LQVRKVLSDFLHFLGVVFLNWNKNKTVSETLWNFPWVASNPTYII
jgi:hypothetical protein